MAQFRNPIMRFMDRWLTYVIPIVGFSTGFALWIFGQWRGFDIIMWVLSVGSILGFLVLGLIVYHKRRQK